MDKHLELARELTRSMREAAKVFSEFTRTLRALSRPMTEDDLAFLRDNNITWDLSA